jgi:hypothetical protein
MPPKLLVAAVPLALLALAAGAGRSHAGLTESGFPVRLTGKDLARLVDDAGDRLREAAPALDADGKASGHRYCR